MTAFMIAIEIPTASVACRFAFHLGMLEMVWYMNPPLLSGILDLPQ